MKRMAVFLMVVIFSMTMFFVCCGPHGGAESLPPELEEVEKRGLVYVTGGVYTQESTDSESDDPYSFSHTISDFSIGKFEVTYELWYAVFQWSIKPENNYSYENPGMEGSVTGGGGPTGFNNIGKEPTEAKYEPVTMVSWRDAIVWCNAYSELMGYTPVYKSDGNVIKSSRGADGTSCDNATVDWDANGFRLPTEGEWQYAASYKDGTDFTSHYFASGASASYIDSDACREVAWYVENSQGKTQPVGEKSANSLGLYDMSGNVFERCWDISGDYPTGPKTDYRGADSGESRIYRGGSWYWGSGHLMVGKRHNDKSSDKWPDVGFRVVRRHNPQ